MRLRGLAGHPEAFTSSFEEDAGKPLAVTQARLAPDGETAMFGAFVEGVLVGSVGLVRDPRRKRRHAAEIVAMYVLSGHARRGIGRALLAHAIAVARDSGAEQLTLTVTQGNDAARRLYAAAGFATFGIEPRAIKVGDRYLAKEHMVLELLRG
ncbi:MAG: GNAT family N-acetyltransferase [Burkholderiales bacterium]|nr:GNAT family N-acetyltransferase [Burkholderiales bacterium]